MRASIAAFTLAVLTSAPAWAVPILDFGVVAPTPGMLRYTGGAEPLNGLFIGVDHVVGIDTPLNAGVLKNIVGGQFIFFTGANTGGWNWGPSAAPPQDSFALFGGIDFNDDGNLDTLVGGFLLFGGSVSATIIPSPGGAQVLVGGFEAYLHPLLTAFYGLPGGAAGPNTLYSGSINLSFLTTATDGEPFESSTLLSGDVANIPVSVPDTLILLAFSLTALGWMVRLQPSLAPRHRLRRIDRWVDYANSVVEE